MTRRRGGGLVSKSEFEIEPNFLDERGTKDNVANIRIVDTPAPTAASVNATSGASNINIQLAPKKLQIPVNMTAAQRLRMTATAMAVANNKARIGMTMNSIMEVDNPVKGEVVVR